jgi:hypothetical protein
MNVLGVWSNGMHNFRLASCSLLLILALGSASTAQEGSDSSKVPPLISDPFDTFGKLSWEVEQYRLDTFAIAILQSSDWVGQIIIYAGRKACAGEAQARAMRMKNYLVNRRDVPPDRIIWRDAGHLEEPSVQLWIARPGYLMPLPVPRSESLPRKDVQLVNCKSKNQRRTKRWPTKTR